MPDPLGFGDMANLLSGNTPLTQANMAGIATAQSSLIPKITTTVRDALTTPPEGLVIYNTTTHKLNVRVAAAWEAVTSV